MEGNLVAIIQGLPDQQVSIVLNGAMSCNVAGLGKGSTVIVRGITQSSSAAQTAAQRDHVSSQSQHRSSQRISSYYPPLPPAYSSLFPSSSAEFGRTSTFRHQTREMQAFIRSLRDYSRPPASPTASRSTSCHGLPGQGCQRRRACRPHRTVNTLHMEPCPIPTRTNPPRVIRKRSYVVNRTSSSENRNVNQARPRVPPISSRRRRSHVNMNSPTRELLLEPPRSSQITRHGRETELLINRLCGNLATGTPANITEELKTWFNRQSCYDGEPNPLPCPSRVARHRRPTPEAPHIPQTSRTRASTRVSTTSLKSARVCVGGKKMKFCPKSGHRNPPHRTDNPWRALCRSPDVRYLNDISRYIRDTLRSVCDNTACPSLQDRYRQHAESCRHSEDQNNNTRLLQDITPLDPQTPQLRPEDVQCTSDGIPLEDLLSRPCQQRKPCGCKISTHCKKWDERLIINDRTLLNSIQNLESAELKERLYDWFSETAYFYDFTFSNKSERQEAAAELAEILTNIAGDERDFKSKAYYEIKEFVNKLPTKYPGSIGELEKCKHEAIENLFKYLVSPESLTSLINEIDNWLIELPLRNIKENKEYRRKLVNEIAAKLKRVVMNQPEDKEEYSRVLFNEIGDVLLTLPLQVKGNVTKVLGHFNDELRMKLLDMRPDDAIKKCNPTTFGIQEEEAVLTWLQSLPIFAANTPSAICKTKTAVADLINILNAVRSKEKQNFRKTLTHHLRYWLRHFAIKQKHFIDAYTTEKYVKELVELFRLPDEDVPQTGLWLDTENIGENITDWLPEIPEFTKGGLDDKRKQKVAKELQAILNSIENDEHFLDNVKAAVENWLEKSDIKFSGSTQERIRRKSEVVQSFLDQITDASGMTGLEREIYEWTKTLPIKRHLGFDTEYFVKESANRLKPIVTDRPEDKEEFNMLLEDQIDEIIDDVPLKIDGNRTTIIRQAKSDLINRLLRLPSDEALLKVKPETFGLKEEKQILSWLSKIPGFDNLDTSGVKDNKRLASELTKVLNPMKQKDPENFEENLREHLKYWLDYNLLKNNTHLDRKTVDNFVEQLVNTLTSEPMQPRKQIRMQLQNELTDILAHSRVRVSRQQELEESVLNSLMKNVLQKENDEETNENILLIFRRANVPLPDAEDLAEELLAQSKNITRSIPTKNKFKQYLKRPVHSIFEVEEIFVNGQDELKSSLIDLLADFKTHKFDDTTAENKIFDKLIAAKVPETKSRDVAIELVKQAREVPKHYPPKRELKNTLKQPVTDLLVQSGVYFRDIDIIKTIIIDLLADYMLGTKTDEDVRTLLVEEFRIANIKEEDVQKLVNMLMMYSKGSPITIPPKRQVKQNLKNPVTEILDDAGVKINNREHFDNSILDALAAYKLGKLDERGIKQTLLDILQQANVSDDAAREILNDLIENIKEIPTSVPPRADIMQNLKNPILEIIRDISQLNNREDLRKNIMDLLVDYKQGKIDTRVITDQLQSILMQAHVPQSSIRGLVNDLIDNCKEVSYSLPPTRLLKQLLKDQVEEILEASGVPYNEELNAVIREILTDYIQGNIDDNVAKDKLFSIFRALDLPMSTTRDLVEYLVDKSKLFGRFVLPKKKVTKKMLTAPFEYVLDQSKIPRHQQKTCKENILHTLAEFKHGSIEPEFARKELFDNLKEANITDIIAKDLANELFDEATNMSIVGPSKVRIKQFLKNPIAKIFKMSGISNDQQDILMGDVTEALAGYKRGIIDQDAAVKKLVEVLKESNIPEVEFENIIAGLMEKTDDLPLPLPEKRFVKQNLKPLVNKILNKTDIPKNNLEGVKDAITESLAIYTQGKTDEVSTKSKLIDTMKTQNVGDNEAIQYADEFLSGAQEKTHNVPTKKHVKLKWADPISKQLNESGIYQNQLEKQLIDILTNYCLGKIHEITVRKKLLQCFRNFEVSDSISEKLIENFLARAEGYVESEDDTFEMSNKLKTDVSQLIGKLEMAPDEHKKLVGTITDTLEDYIMRKNDKTGTHKILYDSFRNAAVSDDEALNFTQKCMEITMTTSKIQELDDSENQTTLATDFTGTEKPYIVVNKSGVHTDDKKLQEQLIGTLTDHIMEKGKKKETKKKLIGFLEQSKVPKKDIKDIIEQLMEYSKELQPMATSSPRSSGSSEESDTSDSSSIGADTHDSESEEEEKTPQEKEYEESVHKETAKWLKETVKDVPEEHAHQLVKDITKDIVKRQKYFRLNPNMKVDEVDELMRYRKKAGLWKNKLEDLDIGKPHAEKVVTKIESLLKAIKKLPSPPQPTYKKISKLEKRMEMSLDDLTVKNAEDIFNKDVAKLTQDLSLTYIENKDKENEFKKKITKSVTNKARELNRMPEIFKDNVKYHKKISEEIDTAASELPPHKDLPKKITPFKSKVKEKVNIMKKKITNDREGQDYKKQLRGKVSQSFPPDAKIDRESFELLKDKLADDFVSANYVTKDKALHEKYKKAIKGGINKFSHNYLEKHPDSPTIPADKLNEYLFDVLKEIPTPKSEILEGEVGEIGHKKSIKKWIKQIPMERPLQGKEKIGTLLNTSILAKELRNLNEQKDLNQLSEGEYNTTVEKKIKHFTKKLPIKPGEQINPQEVSVLLSTKIEDEDTSETDVESEGKKVPKGKTTTKKSKRMMSEDTESRQSKEEDSIQAKKRKSDKSKAKGKKRESADDESGTDELEDEEEIIGKGRTLDTDQDPGVCCYNPYKMKLPYENICSNPSCLKRNAAIGALPFSTATQTDDPISAPCGRMRVECPRHKQPPVIVKQNKRAKQKRSNRGISAMPSNCSSQTYNSPTSADTQTDYPRPYYCQIPSVPCRSYCSSYQKPCVENASAICPSCHLPPHCWAVPHPCPRCHKFAQCELNMQRETRECEIKHSAVGTDSKENMCQPCGVSYVNRGETINPKKSATQANLQKKTKQQSPIETLQEQPQENEENETQQELEEERVQDEEEQKETPREEKDEPHKMTDDENAASGQPSSSTQVSKIHPCECPNQFQKNMSRRSSLRRNSSRRYEIPSSNGVSSPAFASKMFKSGPCENARFPCPYKKRHSHTQDNNNFPDEPRTSIQQSNLKISQSQFHGKYGPCESEKQTCPYTAKKFAQRNSKTGSGIVLRNGSILEPPNYRFDIPDQARYQNTHINREYSRESHEYLSAMDEPSTLVVQDDSTYGFNACERAPTCPFGPKRVPCPRQCFDEDDDEYHTIPECPLRRQRERSPCEDLDTQCRAPWLPCGSNRGFNSRCGSRSPCKQKSQYRRTCPSWDYGFLNPCCGYNRRRCNSPGRSCFRY